MAQIDEFVPPIKGFVELTLRDRETGEILDNEGNNVFLNQGMAEIFKAFTDPTPTEGSTQHVMQKIKLGDDYGPTGDENNPDAAIKTLTEADQSIVYTIDYSEFSISYPNYYTVEYVIVVDGNTVMDQYPNEVDLRINSITMNTTEDLAVAYRRFPLRTITRQVTLDIKWTLTFQGQ